MASDPVDKERGCGLSLPSELNHRVVLGCAEVQLPQISVLDIEQDVVVNSIGRALTLQLEHDHSTVVSCSEHVQGGVGTHHPKSVVFSSECLNTGP